MSVVIDEFEVVTNEEESNQATGSPAITNNATASPTVRDLERVIERQCERYERVWAH